MPISKDVDGNKTKRYIPVVDFTFNLYHFAKNYDSRELMFSEPRIRV